MNRTAGTPAGAATRTMASPSTPALRRTWLALMAALSVAVLGPLPAVHAAGPSGPMTSVIVSGLPGADARMAADVEAVGGQVTQQLGLIDAVVARIPANMVQVLARSRGIVKVSRNSSVHLLSSTYDPTVDVGSVYNTAQMTGAQAMWNAGFTGKGVDVALIDSGLTPVQGLNDPSKVINGPDLSFDSQAANLQHLDAYGHGTFMAGIIGGRDVAGTPASYVNSANFNGIAPDARILSVKVADSNGLTDVSQVIAAISWVIQHRNDHGMNVRVMNLSFATDSSQSEILDPMSFAAEHAWKSGIVVVASAGNAGWKSSGLVNPAYNPYLVAVGASDPRGTVATSDDAVASFSNAGNGVRNPDLVAPGKSMQSLRVPGSYIDQNYGSTGTISDRFFRGSGTSESAAVTSGAAALLIQQRPNATPDQIKAILTRTATSLNDEPASRQGHGEVDLAAAQQAWTPLLATQTWAPATGLGSIEGSRGSVHLTMGGVTLNTDVDIFGAPVGSNLVNAILGDVAWSGGTFNGNSWSGNSWSGNSWSGNSWSGNSWSGNSWSGNSWSGNSWSGNSWSGNSWS
ncbi:MAG: S8 family serine peptidase, partial [Candidatus Dormibacteria bacterium]